jgi:hypothetical protein
MLAAAYIWTEVHDAMRMRPRTLNRREIAKPSNRPNTSRILARGGFITPVVVLEMIPMTGIRECKLKALVTYGKNCPVVCCCIELIKKQRKILQSASKTPWGSTRHKG